MRRYLLLILFCLPSVMFASVFGTVKGVVHDPQHRPLAEAHVVLKSSTSEWQSNATTSVLGQFQFQTVPIGDYEVSVATAGFSGQSQTVRTQNSPR